MENVLEVTRVEIAKMELKAGDVVVIQFQREAPAYARERVQAIVSSVLPDGVGVLVLNPGFEISVLSFKRSGDGEG